MQEPRVLAVPSKESVEYEHNFIKLAVCELRFPVLLELEQSPPLKFQKAVRANYPIYDKAANVTVGPSSAVEQQYNFRSKDRAWTIAFRSFAVSLETVGYTNFEDFMRKLQDVVDHARPVFDSPFFTRVGLRYVNQLPVGGKDLGGWVNRDLVKPIIDGAYGDPEYAWQEVRGSARSGKFTFRCGLSPAAASAEAQYFVDIDVYRETVEVKDVLATVRALHDDGSSLFWWAIGPAARERMGAPKSKPRRK